MHYSIKIVAGVHGSCLIERNNSNKRKLRKNLIITV